MLLALLRPGDHVIAQRCLYGGTFSVFAGLAGRYGIDVSYIAGRDPAELTAALRPESRLLFLETIANPTVAVGDQPALLAAGRAAGLTCVVDNTFATPVLCRPIEHGADIVVHSATKYLGGHDDVTLGLIVSARHEVHRALWRSSVDLGVAADPFAAWLTVRGLKTLSLRMARHCENAAFLAERLAAHPAVATVLWPGLASHPDHAVARRLLSGYGGMVAFDVTGGRGAGLRFITALRLAAMAPSLGGVETLVLHPASTSHRQLDAAGLLRAGFTVLPIVFGADKFANVLTNWERYLAPWIVRIIPLTAHQAMLVVGVIEIAAGIAVAVKPRYAAYIVAAWLAGIVINLVSYPGFYDVALRDFGLMLAALSLARLASVYDPPWGHGRAARAAERGHWSPAALQTPSALAPSGQSPPRGASRRGLPSRLAARACRGRW